MRFEIRDMRYEIGYMRYEIRDMRYEIIDMRYEIQIYYKCLPVGLDQDGNPKSARSLRIWVLHVAPSA